MDERKIKIAFLGNLCNMSFQVAYFMRERGIDVTLYISDNELHEKTSSPVLKDNSLRGELPEWISVWNGAVALLKRKDFISRVIERVVTLVCSVKLIFRLRSYDVILSSSVYSIISSFSGRLYLALAQGDDLRELALRPTFPGWLMRRAFKKAGIVYVSFDEGHRKAIKQIGLSNTRPLFWPYDISKYASKETIQKKNEDRLLIFMPSNQDWGPLQKGNDRFLRAFARLFHEGRDISLILLDRGGDREKARRLVEELKIKSVVRWLPTLNEEQLIEQFYHADIVADQFILGSFGSTALEAMACARPVMIYIQDKNLEGFYPEPPSILNASTEDEIYIKLKEYGDRDKLAEIGNKAREWVGKYHSKEKVVDSLLKDIYSINLQGKSN